MTINVATISAWLIWGVVLSIVGIHVPSWEFWLVSLATILVVATAVFTDSK